VFGAIAGVLLAMVTGWSLAWMFMYIGTIAKSAQSVTSLSVMVLLPLTFVSNAFVPADTLPDWLKTLVNLNPVTHVVTALRDLLNGRAVTPAVGFSLLGCLVVVAIFVPLTVRSYSKKI
jgi:ABC-2 type transport system permease protein